jgi:AraC-like DNA-binding protein
MKIVQWSAPRRRIDREEANGFFEAPLDTPWLFHFSTGELRMGRHAGAFSLKLVLAGTEEYRFGNRRMRLRPGELLFAAAGREYASAIEAPAESVSIFLPDGLAGRFWSAATGEHETLIDDDPMEVPELPAVAWRGCAGETGRLAQSLRSGEDAKDATFALLGAAARSWRRGAPLHALAGPRRRATREELTARVMRARAAIEDMGGVDCSLDLLTEAACLSRFHLLRVFKEAYGRTPGEYARQVRLTRAATMLGAGMDERTAAAAAGYARVGTLRRAQASG